MTESIPTLQKAQNQQIRDLRSLLRGIERGLVHFGPHDEFSKEVSGLVKKATSRGSVFLFSSTPVYDETNCIGQPYPAPICGYSYPYPPEQVRFAMPSSYAKVPKILIFPDVYSSFFLNIAVLVWISTDKEPIEKVLGMSFRTLIAETYWMPLRRETARLIERINQPSRVNPLADERHALSMGEINIKRILPDGYLTAIRNLRAPKRNHGGTHESPIRHLRRGHWRNLTSGGKVWIDEAIVNGGPSDGMDDVPHRTGYKILN